MSPIFINRKFNDNDRDLTAVQESIVKIVEQTSCDTKAINEFREVRIGSKMLGALESAYKLPKLPAPGVDMTRENKSSTDASGINQHDGFHTIHRLYMAAAFALLNKTYTGGRSAVLALIVSKDGEIISWGRKDPDQSTLHGEVIAIERYGKRLPKDCRIYSTLKPCKMCSALVWHMSGGDCKVFHGQHDPGQAAHNTALYYYDMGRKLGGSDAVKGITVWNKSTAKGGVQQLTKVPGTHLGQRLDEGFAQQSRQYDNSVINWLASENYAGNQMKKADTFLERKIKKYETFAQDSTGLNPNVQKAVDYLGKFLKNF